MAAWSLPGSMAPWMPLNWVDWLVLVVGLSGLLSGARRGLILALGGLIAAVAAIVVAAHVGPTLASVANAHWHAARQVAAFLQRYMPLPDGSGQIPYSPSAMQLYIRQAVSQGAIPSGYAAAFTALIAQAGPAVGNPTIGTYVDDALSTRIVDFAAFGVALIVSEVLLVSVVNLVLGRAGRHGWAGLLNGFLGACLGVLERLVEVAAVLAMLASLSVVPAFAGITGALSHSHWARLLLGGLQRVWPAADPMVRSWLTWL